MGLGRAESCGAGAVNGGHGSWGGGSISLASQSHLGSPGSAGSTGVAVSFSVLSPG